MINEDEEILEEEIISEEDIDSVDDVTVDEEDKVPTELTEEEELALQAVAGQVAQRKLEAKNEARIEAEEAENNKKRLTEEARQQDLKDRYVALHDPRMAGAQLGLSNVDLHFSTFILGNQDHVAGEKLLIELESKDQQCFNDVLASQYIELRRQEYHSIDVLFLEAMAEKEAGQPAKMEAYLELRAEIKVKYPKPE